MYVTLVPDSWKTAREFRNLAGSWLYRGQAEDWELETSFVREIKDHIPSIYDQGTFRSDREILILRNYSPEDGQGIGEGRKGWPERARERARRGLRACLRAVER